MVRGRPVEGWGVEVPVEAEAEADADAEVEVDALGSLRWGGIGSIVVG
jgi:hypothetical protein